MSDEQSLPPQDDTESAAANPLAPATEVLPGRLFLLPLSERPFFPAQIMPLLMKEEPWLDTVDRIGESSHHMVALFVTHAESPDQSGPKEFVEIGTVAEVALGKRSVEDFRAVLAARDRSLAGPTAPAGGLFLKEVLYSRSASCG